VIAGCDTAEFTPNARLAQASVGPNIEERVLRQALSARPLGGRAHMLSDN
jgi:hypothetical protein